VKKITGYIIVKVSIEVADDTPDDDILQRVSSECDYHLSQEDDVCKVVDTEIVDVRKDYSY
jgi:hypothetical protein